MGVNITPVDEVTVRQPGERPEQADRVAAPEDHDGVRLKREREIGDLILDDVHAVGAWRRRAELVHADGQFGETADGRDGAKGDPRTRAEAHIAWLAPEAESALKPVSADDDPLW